CPSPSATLDPGKDLALRARHVLGEVDLDPRHAVHTLESDVDALEERRIDLLVLDAGVAVLHPSGQQVAQEPGGVRAEPQEADRFAHQVVPGRAAAHDVAHTAVPHE